MLLCWSIADEQCCEIFFVILIQNSERGKRSRNCGCLLGLWLPVGIIVPVCLPPRRQQTPGLIHPCAHTELGTCRPQGEPVEQRCPESNHTCSLLQAGKGAGPGPALGRVSDQAPRMMDQGEEDDEEEAWLQLRPVEPLPSQCCGSGCSPCVFDVYQRELARWEAARASKDRSLLSREETQVRGGAPQTRGPGVGIFLTSALYGVPAQGSFL